MLEKYFLRRPVTSDAEAVLELLRRTDTRDLSFAKTDLVDLLYDWERCNPARDAWLAIDARGQLRGYGACLPWEAGYLLDIHDDVGTEQGDLFLGLLILCEKRAASLIQEIRQAGKESITAYASSSSAYQARVLQEAGYSQNMFIFHMYVDLSAALPRADLLADMVIRTATKDQDERAVHALVQASFDWRDRKPQTCQDGQNLMSRSDIYDETLCFLAERDGELIGACLGEPHEDFGWVRHLVVRKDQRGRGVGRALLLHILNTFKQRGFLKAILTVESQNPTACQFYENSGMTRAVTLTEFIKKVPI